MPNPWLTRGRFAAVLLAFLGLMLVCGMIAPGWISRGGGFLARADRPQTVRGEAAPAPAPKPPAPGVVEPPAVEDVLKSGVLIVVSKASQRMYVFKDGRPWKTSPVSTGRRGHATPSGVFPILQKKVFHRSNIYSNAPMPFMQRLTWSGIALHAGHLPGYPASHGCIRLPREFAQTLYGLTRASATTVVIANEPIKSNAHAQRFALNARPPKPAVPGALPQQADTAQASNAAPSIPTVIAPHIQPAALIPAAATVPAVTAGPAQTIQLTAAASAAEAEAHWNRLLGARPDLARFEKAVIPAIVGNRRVYRLRVSAPDAHAYCTSLQNSGIACFRVG